MYLCDEVELPSSGDCPGQTGLGRHGAQQVGCVGGRVETLHATGGHCVALLAATDYHLVAWVDCTQVGWLVRCFVSWVLGWLIELFEYLIS